MNKKNNFLEANPAEILRLKTLSKMYNNFTLNHLISIGLKEDMTILEFSSRIGFFAIELAKFVGSKGKIIAIYNDADSLNITEKIAQNAGINNIDFRLCTIENLASLNAKFDMAYGRWTLIYNNNLDNCIEQLQKSLKPGGKLICEELNFEEHGSFSYPYEKLIHEYHTLTFKNSQKLNLEPNTASKLYNLFKTKNFTDITINTNQPLRTSEEEKSVYRLGLESMSSSIVENKLCSENELSEMIKQMLRIEKNNSIIGGYRNLIISGRT